MDVGHGIDDNEKERIAICVMGKEGNMPRM
jgi:hypothetical protein